MLAELLRAGPAALLLLALAAWPPGGAAPSAGFEVYHYSSDIEGRAFREVFIVHAVSPGLKADLADVQVLRDGLPLPVEWQDADGRVTVGDRFSFVQEAFDRKQVLTARHAGRQVMECLYGGGAGFPFTPDELRAMGLGDDVRCLRLTDDQ